MRDGGTVRFQPHHRRTFSPLSNARATMSAAMFAPVVPDHSTRRFADAFTYLRTLKTRAIRPRNRRAVTRLPAERHACSGFAHEHARRNRKRSDETAGRATGGSALFSGISKWEHDGKFVGSHCCFILLHAAHQAEDLGGGLPRPQLAPHAAKPGLRNGLRNGVEVSTVQVPPPCHAC